MNTTANGRLLPFRAIDTGRQTIRTRYHGPDANRGSRITATAGAGSLTIPYPRECHGHSGDAHARACEALAAKLEWGGEWRGGAVPNSPDYVWVDISGTVPATGLLAAVVSP